MNAGGQRPGTSALTCGEITMDRLKYEGLKPFCQNELQAERLLLSYQLGSMAAAARQLGCSESAVKQTVKAIEIRAARKGFSPDEDSIGQAPEGYAVKGKSTLYGEDGSVKLQWVKTSQDAEAQYQAALQAVEALKEEVPHAKPQKRGESGPESLLNAFIVTDYHLGLKVWGEETRGADWDLAIAEQLLVDWFATTIERMMPAHTAIFAQMGDFLHWDGMMGPVTPASGHILDADDRFQKVVRTAIRVLRQCTSMLLDTHEHVHIIHAEGNHDPASSVWLRELFHAFYENEPRVTVDTSADPYYAYQHGKTALFFHHGHKRKPANIDHVLARKFRQIYGAVEHTYAHLGHLHHNELKDTNLMVVEQHRTLAAQDAYASRGGWMSGRDSKGITYHKEYGEVSRVTVNPDMCSL